jgi:hypothetical protein
MVRACSWLVRAEVGRSSDKVGMVQEKCKQKEPTYREAKEELVLGEMAGISHHGLI